MSLKNKILRALGINETRLKWKMAQREERDSGGGDDDARPARATTKHCPQCRALTSADERTCPSCQAALPSMATVRVTRALRSLLPDEQPTTKVVLAVIFGLFVVMTLDAAQALGGDIFGALMRPPMEVMWRWGAHVRGDFEPWRLITSNFLHFGIIHLLFNAYALRIAGPEVERTFGSAMALVLFVVTGVGAMAISNVVGGPGIVAGASGALMGFIGLAIAGGHRDASSHGRMVRDQMIRWAAIVMFIGIAASLTNFMGMAVDNLAHGAGLVLGGGLGMVLPMRTLRRRPGPLQRRLVALGVVAALATLGFGVHGMIDAQLGRRAFDACIDDIREERWSRAVDTCTQALEGNRSFAGAYNNLALAHLGAANGEAATAVCAEASARFDRATLARDAPVCMRLVE